MKGQSKIAMLTAYDYPMARLVDKAGVDIVLVGDSLGMVMLGFDTTLSVTMDMMTHHCAAVSRGVTNALVVADMPFMSYKICPEQALENAARLIQEGGVEAVKIEGGAEMAHIACALVDAGIAVMGHIGLTPQSVHLLSGYKVQGKDHQQVQKLLDDAAALEEAGIFSLVVEAVPEEVGKLITEHTKVPTIGIGAGRYCDGQVLVINDILGLTFGKKPKFANQYTDLGKEAAAAIDAYIKDVREGKFPTEDNCYRVN
jgi:3-methyl-2-oxobutanoate hydroxymethyltransferase